MQQTGKNDLLVDAALHRLVGALKTMIPCRRESELEEVEQCRRIRHRRQPRDVFVTLSLDEQASRAPAEVSRRDSGVDLCGRGECSGCGSRRRVGLCKHEPIGEVVLELVGTRLVRHQAHGRDATQARDELATIDFEHQHAPVWSDIVRS